ncbi:glycerol-3-phosphate 1-O-acyltransferase PlsY [Entomobacter blattae]|uniref:Glycerol-3-phosphate acyltransferase n=1 Tax=Entomobacter blattae TaxID=2762277 RepID=A0A7H1NUP0_9PROT|nr:glycerol-3-phosphate 1-O-acyltransferase PlsY [Entomobacter blattae]QNT79500.1 Glycerol-3-phosphate acyltransferase [Entomobacter blattae]
MIFSDIPLSLQQILVTIIEAYILGSIPFGLVITYLFYRIDIRKVSSGNIGATNVLRTGKKGAAGLTLLLDAAKGALAVLSAGAIASHHILGGIAASSHVINHDSPDNAEAYAMALAAVFVVWGHCFPVWLKFKGGKGVATGLAVIAVLSPATGILSCLIWLVAALLSRMSSVGALAAFLGIPVLMHIIHKSAYSSPIFWATCLITLTIFLRHRQNIRRIIHGKEPLIHFSLH